MSQCNYCQYQQLLRKAKEGQKQEKQVTIKPSAFTPGGVEIYVHGKSTKPTRRHWVAWFMQLPDHCIC